MSWDQETSAGKKERKWLRALWALPMLLCTYGASQTMGAVISQVGPSLIASVKTGEVILGNGEIVPLVRKFVGIGGLDKVLAVLVTFFTPTLGGFDSLGRLQALAFLGDIVPFQVLMYVESVRRGNLFTAAYLFPTLMGIAYQMKGLGYVAPIYFFLHYVQSPLENYQAADNRMLQIGAIKTIIPTVALTFIAPSLAMIAAPGLSNRQWINGLFWQAFPVYGALSQRVLGLVVKDTTSVDRIENPEADLPYLRWTYGFAAAFASITNLYVRATSPYPLLDVFFKDIASPTAPANIIQGAARFLKYDQIWTFGACSIWILLSFWDLKKASKTEASWAKIIGAYAGATAVAGPGAAMIGMWAWREEILAARKSAVIKKTL